MISNEIVQEIENRIRTIISVLVQFEGVKGFYVRNNDSDYCGVPTGYIEGLSLVALIKEWQMEIVRVEGGDLILRAEWGNGEGFDTFTVSLK